MKSQCMYCGNPSGRNHVCYECHSIALNIDNEIIIPEDTTDHYEEMLIRNALGETENRLYERSVK